MPAKIHIDIETFSDVDLKTCGVYRYVASPLFEVLIICMTVELENGATKDFTIIPSANIYWTTEFKAIVMNYGACELYAHNASFERLCLSKFMPWVNSREWVCSAVKAASCGLPRSLDDISKELELGDEAKSNGKDLIKYFCNPCKPTKKNGMRTRNLREHAPEEFEIFIAYCRQDVVAEMALSKRLERFATPPFERELYKIDQIINDRGVMADRQLAESAVLIDELNTAKLMDEARALTGLENPNSPKQLMAYLGVGSVAKDALDELYSSASDHVKQVIELRQELAKSSVSKYSAILNCINQDDRIRGMFVFGGAGRTQRWSGKHVQLQNLPRNYMKGLDTARKCLKLADYEIFTANYDNISGTLSQLIRTALTPAPGHKFLIADYSAIEARVLAWLAGQEWRMEVFRTHGKIYEASAAKMFKVPIESIVKGSEERAKGKIAELALGYGGAVGALMNMGGEAMGLSEDEMKTLVRVWRMENSQIGIFWSKLEACAIETAETGRRTGYRLISFRMDGDTLCMTLPSGRDIRYHRATLTTNKYGQVSIKYRGKGDENGKLATPVWTWVDTWGGKLTENAVQAVSRDIMAGALIRLEKSGFKTVMHIHDEAVAEEPEETATDATLKVMCDIMADVQDWAKDCPIKAEGFISDYYKKD